MLKQKLRQVDFVRLRDRQRSALDTSFGAEDDQASLQRLPSWPARVEDGDQYGKPRVPPFFRNLDDG